MKENPRWKIKGQDAKEVARLLRSGASCPTVAARFGVSSSTIHDVAKRLGIRVCSHPNPIHKHDAAIRALAPTCRPDEIAAQIGASRSGVRDYMVSNGIAWNKRIHKKWTEEEAKQVEEMAKAGGTCESIAAKFSVKRNVLYEFAKRRGIRFETNRWRTQETLDKLYQMWLDGHRASRAGKLLGVPTTSTRTLFDDWDEVATREEAARRATAMYNRYERKPGQRPSHSTAQGEAA